MTITFKGGIIASGEIKAEVNIAPVWSTDAGTIGTFDELSVVNFQLLATDPEGGSLTYSIISGSVSAGLSLSSSGLISGTADDVESATTSGFSVRITDEGGLFQDRTFSMEVAPPPNLFAWGENEFGQLGLGSTTDYSSPTAVGQDVNWSAISKGQEHSLAVKSDGTLWSWGRSNNGQLGHGTTIDLSSPVQIGSLTTWSLVSAGQNHSLALKTDGIVWSWGKNNRGQLGINSYTNKSSPIQVSGSNSGIKSIATADEFSFMLKTDGKLFAFGHNTSGGLGTGNTNVTKFPTQVGSASDWDAITAGGNNGHAIKTDGTLWGWGQSFAGKIGNGDGFINISSPIQISGLTTWTSVVTGRDHSFATKSDYTLWTWGLNEQGQLGLSNTTVKSVPTQVPGGAIWSKATANASLSLAIRTDGTLWAWGRSWSGGLGIGASTRSSPSQVGSLTTWTNITIGGTGSSNGHSMALR